MAAWSQSPQTLGSLCVEACLRNLTQTLCYRDTTGCAGGPGGPGTLRLRPDVFLPSEIADRLVNAFVSLHSLEGSVYHHHHHQGFLRAFSEPQAARLQRVSLREFDFSDSDLDALCNQALVELDLTHCEQLTARSLRSLRRCRRSLTALALLGCPGVFCEPRGADDDHGSGDAAAGRVAAAAGVGVGDGAPYVPPGEAPPPPPLTGRHGHDGGPPADERKGGSVPWMALAQDASLACFERLRFVSLGGLPRGVDVGGALGSLPALGALHLSSTELPDDPSFLLRWRSTLRSLGLHNCGPTPAYLRAVCLLAELRHLDISRDKAVGQQCVPLSRGVLCGLAQGLPHLEALDLSGNTFGDGCTVGPDEEAPCAGSTRPSDSSIVPFRCRSQPFQFLGLFGTTLCTAKNIPAHVVTGEESEAHVLNAIEAYTDLRPEVASTAINCLFVLARISRCQQPLRALQLVVCALRRHRYNRHVQVTGSAALFYLTGSEYRAEHSEPLRRQVLSVVLNGMEAYQEVTVQRNCCLTLCNFGVPEELEFAYGRATRLLLAILQQPTQDSVQRIAVHLCNALVCQVDHAHKEAVGRMGFVRTMMKIIRYRLLRKTCDQVMEFSWSALWNITDETPDNCKIFLMLNGMPLFLECLHEFPRKQELHRNMLGLLGNVAEVKSLRPFLMTTQFVTVFSELLESDADGIEVSYNACGMLAHMLHDGEGAWGDVRPPRHLVAQRMWSAIARWDATSRRNINYRSFEPILRLIPQSVSPVSQHWATWALYNLITVYPDKYCPLLIAENGPQLLLGMLDSPSTHAETKEKARKVIELCRDHQQS